MGDITDKEQSGAAVVSPSIPGFDLGAEIERAGKYSQRVDVVNGIPVWRWTGIQTINNAPVASSSVPSTETQRRQELIARAAAVRLASDD